MAPVVRAFRTVDSEFEVILCATGQHGEVFDEALAEFGLTADLDLELLHVGQSLPEFTARAITALTDTVRSVSPELLFVQGDTSSAFAGALAGYYSQVDVAHVEAGLRSGDRYRPFPEEGNRRLISGLAALHFAPTRRARQALRREGIVPASIFVTGNTGIDALLYARASIGSQPSRPRRMILVTLHRRESWGAPLESMCRALVDLVERNTDIEVVFPVHPAPMVRDVVRALLGAHPRIALLEPRPYRSFVALLDSAYFVLTDSGGVQEEAPALGKPVLVLRETTERAEAVTTGSSRLVGTGGRRLLAAAERLLRDERAYEAMAQAHAPFGDGHAAARIVHAARFRLGFVESSPSDWQPAMAAPRRVA